MVDAVTVSRGPTRMTPLTDRVALNWKGGIPVARPSRGRRRNSTEVVAGMTAA
jgi:hypothetical protein